jgi:hypothetical protein
VVYVTDSYEYRNKRYQRRNNGGYIGEFSPKYPIIVVQHADANTRIEITEKKGFYTYDI